MKHCLILLFVSCLTTNIVSMETNQTFSLTVNMSGFRNDKGIVRVGLIDGPAGFPADPQRIIDNRDVNIQNKRATAVFPNVKAGKYVVAVFHDENNSKKIDMNFLGIPKEGFSFSNNPSLWKLKPSYEDCQFSIEKNTDIPLQIKYLF